MNIKTILYLTWSLAFAAGMNAQESSSPVFEETALPDGALRGLMQVNGRCGALIAGGRLVYSNDIFIVTTHGRSVRWRVLSVTKKDARFARERTASDVSIPPPLSDASNFGTLLMLLERGAQAYTSASTRPLKTEAIKTTWLAAITWCMSNPTICVRGTLADVTILNDQTVLLRLKDLDCRPFKSTRSSQLYVYQTFQQKLHLRRERALEMKAGDTVILSGQPVFHPEAQSAFSQNDKTQPYFVHFRIRSDGTSIGSLEIFDSAWEIFDPKKETLRPRP